MDGLRPASEVLRRGAEAIRRGAVIAAPTDTLYGLLADSSNPRALRRVFRAKGRPESKPVLLLIDRQSRVDRIARDIPAEFAILADAFWPGPLTVVLRARADVHAAVTAGRGTVAVRLPRSPLVRALARLSNRPLTGTSANRSGRAGARSADEVCAQLGARLPLVLDSGRVARTAASTIVDLTADRPRVLRAGRIGPAEVDRALRRAFFPGLR